MNKEETERKEAIYQLKKKEPILAIILSLLIVGSGSMYARNVTGGIILLLTSLMLWIMFLGWIIWLISPVIAYHDTKQANKLLRLELGLL